MSIERRYALIGHTHAGLGGSPAWGDITGTLSAQTDLQAALDLKLNSSAYTAADVLSKLLTVDGAASSLDADLLDGQQGAYYLAYANLTGVPSTFTPSAHTHSTTDVTNLSSYTGFDSRYYTESEITAFLAGKSDTSHTHSYLPLSGGTLTGALSFGSSTYQMLNLYSTTYGMGVQSSTIYTRTASNVAWHLGGTHSNTALDPGAGGAVLGYVDTNGWNLYAGGFARLQAQVAYIYTNTNNGIAVRDSAASLLGYVYHDTGQFGLLQSSGQWMIRSSTSVTEVYGYNGTSYGHSMIVGEDSWLRLNADSGFSNGVYTPGNITINGSLYDYNAGSTRPYLHLTNTGVTSGGNVTYSTSAPSGGADGDIWLVYTA